MAIKIKGLMDNYDEYYWAVAWASSKTALADELLQRKGKIKQIVVGIDFDQTDPDFLDMMTSVSRSRVASYPSGGTFHPKVYYFQSRRQAAAIVGSANFTRGGTELNVEISILMEGKSDDEQLISLKNIVNKLWKTEECYQDEDSCPPDLCVPPDSVFEHLNRAHLESRLSERITSCEFSDAFQSLMRELSTD